MIPLSPPENKPWYDKNFHDPNPLLGVFLHMHSDLAPDPLHALQLFFLIRSGKNLRVEIPDQEIEVQIDGLPSRKVNLKLLVIEEMKSADKLYPHPKYDIRLVDREENKWEIRTVNQFFYLIKGDPEIVQLPKDRVSALGKGKREIRMDDKAMQHIWISGTENIWPAKQNLRDSQISIRLPRMTINDIVIEARRLDFPMNYEAVKKDQGQETLRRCPSTEMIFRWNDWEA